MPSQRTLQQSFAGGEMAPEMLARLEDVAVQTGARRMRNVISSPRGSASSRPGFGHVADAKVYGPTRVEGFTFSRDQTVVLVFGDYYVRFLTLGAPILFDAPASAPDYVAPQNILSVNLANNTVTFGVAHGLEEDDRVEARATVGTIIEGLTEGGLYYARVVDPTTIAFRMTPGGADVDLVSFAGGSTNRVYRAYAPGDVVAFGGQWAQCTADRPLEVTPASAPAFWQLFDDGDVYEISTPFAAAEVMDLVMSPDTQSGDVLTITHPEHAAVELRRLGPAQWSLVPIEYGPTLQPPSPVSVAPTTGQGYDFTVGHENPGPAGDLRIALPTGGGGLVPAKESGFTNGTYVYIDAPGYTYVPDGQPLSRRWVVFNDTPGNNNEFEIALEGSATIVQWADLSPAPTPNVTIVGKVFRSNEFAVDTVSKYVITSIDENGVESEPSIEFEADNDLTIPGAYNTVTFTGVPQAKRYRVYKNLNGIFGMIAEVAAGQPGLVIDDDLPVDQSITPPLRDEAVDSAESQIGWDDSNDRIEWPGHGLDELAELTFHSSDTLDPGVTAGVTYYARNVTLDDFQVSATPTGAIVNIQGGSIGLQFARSGDHPRAFAFYEDRGVIGGTRERPQRVMMTRAGTRSDLSYGLPPQPDDRISIDPGLRRASEIRHLIPLDNLIMLTNSAEVRIFSDGGLTAETLLVRPQSEEGASKVQPLVVSNVVLFPGARGGHVFALAFQAAAQRFEPLDMSHRAQHLFDGKQIVDSAQMRAPFKISWWVSSAGELLGFTFLPQERVAGWHVHDTPGGRFESCAAVAEDGEDRLYAVVDRVRNGVAVKTIERMGPQLRPEKVADCQFLDAALSYDGANTSSTTLTLSDGTSWGPNDELLVTSSDPLFVGASDVGDQVVLESGGVEYRLTITAFVSTTAVRAKANAKLPAALQNVVTTEWALARDTLTGLDSLEGAEVAMLADGVVLPPVTVSGGTLGLPAPAAKVHVGLDYDSDLIPRPLAFAVDGLGKGRGKRISEAWIDVVQTAGLQIGPDASSLRAVPGLDPTALQTGTFEVTPGGRWTDDGEVLLRQSGPLPFTVAGLTLRVAIER